MKKILCIERGGEHSQNWVPVLLLNKLDTGLLTHFQSLSTPPNIFFENAQFLYPWKFSADVLDPTSVLRPCAGCHFAFGGKSCFWFGWSPRPSPQQMRDFPQGMLDATTDPRFWSGAADLLNVQSVDKLKGPFFHELQNYVTAILENISAKVETATACESASFSISRCDPHNFSRFSVPGPLNDIVRSQEKKAMCEVSSGTRLDITLGCAVTKLQCTNHNGKVDAIVTDKGVVTLTPMRTKVVLCAGVSIYTLLEYAKKSANNKEGNTKQHNTPEFFQRTKRADRQAYYRTSNF